MTSKNTSRSTSHEKPTKAYPHTINAVLSQKDNFAPKEIARNNKIPIYVVEKIIDGNYVELKPPKDLKKYAKKLWRVMIQRCDDADCIGYKRYGGRGIRVCEEWYDFEKFYAWSLENGYDVGTSIERKDFDVGYFPDNCVWISMHLQGRNKCNNRRLTAFGKIMTVIEWAESEECVVHWRQFRQRIDAGWDVERALTEPIDEKLSAAIKAPTAMYTAFGQSKSILDWVADPRCATSEASLRRRLHAGLDFETALTMKSVQGGSLTNKRRKHYNPETSRLNKQPKPKKEPKNPKRKSKVTPELLESIKDMATSPPKEIAQKLNVSISVVNNVLADRFEIKVDTRTKRDGLKMIWKSVIGRCCRETHQQYAQNGAKGIRVCEEWQDFENFYKWGIEQGYECGLVIDRNDRNLGYSPNNCIWISKHLMNRTRQGVRYITAFGKTLTLIEWTEMPECRVSRTVLKNRIDSGWKPETAITREPSRTPYRYGQEIQPASVSPTA